MPEALLAFAIAWFVPPDADPIAWPEPVIQVECACLGSAEGRWTQCTCVERVVGFEEAP